jgi:N-acetylglutamate synthase
LQAGFDQCKVIAQIMDNLAQLSENQLALVAQLEASLLNVWPSIDLEMMDGWAVRAAMGYSGRANSASALKPHSNISPQLLRRITDFLTARKLPTIVRASPLCAPGTVQILEDAGFTSRGLAYSMIARLPETDLPTHAAVKLETTPTTAWLVGNTSLQQEESKRNPKALEAIVRRIRVPAVFATVQLDGKDIGYGICAIDGNWAEISSIVIKPHYKGKGFGRALVQSLLGWSQRIGTHSAYLQVDVTNTPAINLYRSLNFEVLYDYDTLKKNLA